MEMAGVTGALAEMSAQKSSAVSDKIVADAIKTKDMETIINPDPEHLAPLEGRILLKKMKVQEKQASGLYLPEKAQMAKGTVYARVVRAAVHRLAQDGVTLVPMKIKKDMIVLINEYGGLPVGRTEDHVIMTEVEILGIHEGPTGNEEAAMKSFSNNPRAIG